MRVYAEAVVIIMYAAYGVVKSLWGTYVTQLKGCPFPGKGSFKGNETGYGTRDAGVGACGPVARISESSYPHAPKAWWRFA